VLISKTLALEVIPKEEYDKMKISGIFTDRTDKGLTVVHMCYSLGQGAKVAQRASRRQPVSAPVLQ